MNKPFVQNQVSLSGQLQNQIQTHIQNTYQGQFQGPLSNPLQGQFQMHQAPPQSHFPQSQISGQTPLQSSLQTQKQAKSNQNRETLKKKILESGEKLKNTFESFNESLLDLPTNTEIASKQVAYKFEDLLLATDNLEMLIKDYMSRLVKKEIEQSTTNANTEQEAQDSENKVLEDMTVLIS